MLHAPTDLQRRQKLLQGSDHLTEIAAALLAHSRVLIARGCASVTYAEPPVREGGVMAPRTSLAILVIDDEPSFVSALTRVLRHDGGTVDTAADGRLALRQLQKHRYDVVLCDLRMPGLDGADFYAILCQQHPYLRQRVLFLTGDTLGANSQAFLEQCGQPWLAKPCDAATIRSAIQRMLQTV
jgi:CheY-like chemotaxis protein